MDLAVKELTLAAESKVSIVIPYFKHADFLPEAVCSALQQTYTNLEVIVVDDCSSGQCAKDILASVADPRLSIVRHQERMGVSVARNTGASYATGEFIFPLDCDDVLEPEHLAKCLAAFDSDIVGGVYTAVKIFGDETGVYSPQWNIIDLVCGRSGALVCVLSRKKMFDQVGGFNPAWRVGEDSDYFVRCTKAGWQFKKVEEPLYKYRKHSTATTANNQAKDMQEMVANLLRDHRDLYIEYLDEVITFKEERFWKSHEEYRHLHDEFHKLLALYENLLAGQQTASSCRSLSAHLKSYLKRGFGKLLGKV